MRAASSCSGSPVSRWRSALLVAAGCLASGCTVIALDTRTPIPERRSVHSEVSVGLYVPAEIREQALVFALSEDAWYPEESRRPRAILVEDAFTLGLAQIVEAYFPQTTLYREEPPPGAHDLLIRAALAARADTEESLPGMSLWVRLDGSLDILSQDGQLIDQAAVEGVGHHRVEDLSVRQGAVGGVIAWRSTGSMTEAQNLYDLGRIAGDEAMGDLLRQLVGFLKDSPGLSAHLAALREERAQPAELVATVRFEDAQGLLPNQRLDAGETGELVVQVENRGPGQAYGVTLAVSSADPELEVPGSLPLGELPPGESREVRLPVKAGLKLTDGSRHLLVEAREKRGYHARKALLEVATVRLLRPALRIADILLDDRGGKAQGDGDGQPANGEVMEATVFVRNAGTGDAGDVEVLLGSATPQVEILEGSFRLGAIPAGQLREARFLLRLPHTLAARELELRAAAVEGRGEGVSRGQLIRAWPVLSRSPDLELDWRIFDGTSPASSGNRDGRVNNGERIEIVATPANRGQVGARNVSLAVASADPGVSIQPARTDLPDLPAGTEAVPVSLLVEVPRTFAGERLLLRAVLEQRDFPARETEISLPVVRQLPSLAAHVPVAAVLQQGERRQFQLQIENRGGLEARDVRLQVVTRWPSLDVLGGETVALGSLAPHSTALPVPLDLFAKRSAPPGRALVEVTLQQADFPPAVHEIPFEVTAENPVYLQTTPEVPQDLRGRPPAGAAKPVIVFRRYESGQIVADEEISLTFEIYDEVGLAHVGVTHNGRALPLTPPSTGPAAEGSDPAQRRQVTRYTVPVRLDLGMNELEVAALNFDGGSLARSLALTRAAREGQVWAAVIGVSRYQDPDLSLQFAESDAEAFASYLRSGLGAPAGHILVLKNEAATRRQVIEAIGDWLPRRAEANDTVFLYFAGHGARDEDPGSPDGLEKYLLPYDAATGSYNSTSINFEELKRQIERIRAARIILVLDTCFSGAAAGGRTVFDPRLRTRGVLTEEFLADLAEGGKGTVLLLASGVNELAYEPPELGHGVFTYYLLEGLRGAADAHPFGNADGLLSVDEAYLYASRKVREKTRNHQNPQKFGGGSGEIVLGRVRAGEEK